MENYNLIIELGVDLIEELSAEQLKKELQAKQIEWSKIKSDTLDPKERTRAADNLNLLEKYKKLLESASEIKACYEEARNRTNKARTKATEELEKEIDFYWKGPNEKALNKLIERFTERGFSEQEIRSKVKAKEPEKPAGRGSAKQDLDLMSFNRLHKQLEAFGKPSLFDFLELPQSSNPNREQLLEASRTAETLYRSRGSSDPRNETGKDIAGLGLKICGAEDIFRKYLDWLKDLPLRTELGNKLSKGQELSVEQYLDLLKQEELLKIVGGSISSLKVALDGFIASESIVTKFCIDNPNATLTCFCHQSGKLLDYKCPAGHVLFYECSKCCYWMPRNKLTCVCFDLKPIINRIRSYEVTQDWDALSELIAEEKLTDMDYFASGEYKKLFDKMRAGIKGRQERQKVLERQYKQFCTYMDKGDLRGAISLLKKEFASFPGFEAYDAKLKGFKPGKIKVKTVRDRGTTRILELDVPPDVTHIGVKISGQTDVTLRTTKEVGNMLKISKQCSGVTIYGVFKYADIQSMGKPTIQTFEPRRLCSEITFSLDWVKPILFVGRKSLTVEIRNSGKGILDIPKTLVVADFSTAIPLKPEDGTVLMEFGPTSLAPMESQRWEVPLDKIKGCIGVNLFAKNDPHTSYIPQKGTKQTNDF